MKKTCFVLIFIAIASASPADDNKTFRKNEIKFIKELYSGGRYFDTIAETVKLYPAEKNPEIEYFIYTNYFLAGQYSTIINNYNVERSSDDLYFQSILLLSGSFLKKSLYPESYAMLRNYEYKKLPQKYLFTMFLRRVEPLILSGEDEKIEREIAESRILLEDNYNYVNLREELQQYKKDGLKSPVSAAIMSAVFPGLGQCYAGYPAQGLISLLSVAVTAAGGIYMRDNGRKGFSYTMFFFSGLFYGGNIYGAYNSAASGNNEVIEKRHKSIISQYGVYNPGGYIDMERVFN